MSDESRRVYYWNRFINQYFVCSEQYIYVNIYRLSIDSKVGVDLADLGI